MKMLFPNTKAGLVSRANAVKKLDRILPDEVKNSENAFAFVVALADGTFLPSVQLHGNLTCWAAYLAGRGIGVTN